MYIKKNLPKPSGISSGASAPKDPNITIIDVEDIVFFPPRDSKGVKLLGNFTFKNGAKMYQFYSTSSKISAPYESDGDEDAVSISQKLEAQHPGNSLEAKEFIQNWLGKNVIILVGSCQDNFYEVLGTKCAPLQLKPAKTDNNEGRFHSLVFEQFSTSGYLPGHYEGTMVYTEPYEVTTVGEVSLTEDNGNQYKIPSLDVTDTIEFDTITLEHDEVVSLIGSGGEAPATLSGGTPSEADYTVVLVANSDWVALENAVINLQVFDAGDHKYLIEVSRS